MVVDFRCFRRVISFTMIRISDRVQPESRMERIIKQSYLLARSTERMIDKDSSFRNQTKLTNQITRAVEGDAFPTMNGGDMRFKREISRARRDCEMSAERCEMLLQTMESYLKTLKNNALSDENPVPVLDILKCLRCKNLQSSIANEFNEDPTPRSHDQYFPLGKVEQNRSSKSDITAIKLLDKEEAKRAEVNRTEAAKIQATTSLINNIPQDSVNQSLRNVNLSEIITSSLVNGTNYINSQQVDTNTAGINNSSTMSINKESDGDLITIDSRTMTSQINGNSSSASNADQQIESGSTTSEIVTLQFNTTELNNTTQYTVTKDDTISKRTTDYSVGSTEANTRYTTNIIKQVEIAENVTSMPAGYDVTEIDNDDDNATYPSVQPSLEGHPENQSATTINGRSQHYIEEQQ